MNGAASPLYEDESVLEVRLRGPFGTLFEDMQVLEYRPFVLVADGSTHDVEVRLRGRSRRRVCEFPPLRLKFPKAGAPGTVFDGQRRVKLVTHCRNSDRGEQDLLEEYLAYRIFNLLTDHSYRARLIRFSYEDTTGKLPGGAALRYGFAIESRTDFEKRTKARAATLRGVPKDRYDQDEAALIYVFEYLIANTDFQLTKADYDDGCCHNIDLFERDGQVILVPYDLDLAGLVDARYAYPDPKLRIKKVTQRLYRGVCTDREVLRGAIRRIKAEREAILGMPARVPGLTTENAERARDFLGAFFDKAENEEKLLRRFERRCI